MPPTEKCVLGHENKMEIANMKATREDIRRIHERIDTQTKEWGEKWTTVEVTLAEINTTLKMTPKPAERPCGQLTEHLENHKEAKATWQRPIIRAGIDLLKMAIVGTIAFYFGRR